jgi:hypothetical protein
MRHVLAGILKIIAVAVLLVGVCLYVVANYSELTQELTCKGYWKELGQNKEVAEVAHVRLTEYRWWVHLWSESDGNVQAQTEKFALVTTFRLCANSVKAVWRYTNFGEVNPHLLILKAVTARRMGNSHSNSRITWFSSAHRAGRDK